MRRRLFFKCRWPIRIFDLPIATKVRGRFACSNVWGTTESEGCVNTIITFGYNNQTAAEWRSNWYRLQEHNICGVLYSPKHRGFHISTGLFYITFLKQQPEHVQSNIQDLGDDGIQSECYFLRDSTRDASVVTSRALAFMLCLPLQF